MKLVCMLTSKLGNTFGTETEIFLPFIKTVSSQLRNS
uniref:Uncharacterized protein n=1 Tax=Anguilla anguilla TaxID=7936 RepID=A0A0E9S8D0_ANGAN